MKVSIPRRYQLWKATPRDASRPVLTNIFIDISCAPPMAVAANGYILAAVPCEIEGDKTPALIPAALIPAALYKAGVSWATKEHRENVVFEVQDGKVSVSLLGGLLTIPMPLDSFPSWQKLIPFRYSLAPVPYVSYNTLFLTAAFKALGIEMETDMNAIHQFGQTGAGLIVDGMGGFALVMPQFSRPDMAYVEAVFKLRESTKKEA